MQRIELKPVPFVSLFGISDKTISVHHDKLYAGYVAKMNEISEKLTDIIKRGDFTNANQTYSELRGLKDGEVFATNGVYLHEAYFDVLGGDGKPTGAITDEIIAKFGSWETFVHYFTACGMASRGWVVLCWDTQLQKLNIYSCDAHNNGGVWGCVPILVLDVYEHAYFMDYEADRKIYIENWWKNLNFTKINGLLERAKK